jgi:cell division control protein 11
MANIYANGIIKFIEHQFEFTLEQESKVKRNPKSPDYQIHCLLYFLNPDIILGSKGITLIDKIVLERLCNYVNVIPCLAKSELVTIRDLQQIQGFIRRDMTEFTIFRFGDEPEDLELDIMMPFCIVNSEEYYKDTDGNRSMGINVNGEQVLGREYKWGTILVENPDQCDFIPLVNSILGSHVKELKDRTREWYYEIWRTENLTRKRQSVFIPTDLKEKLKSLEFEKEE